MFVHKLLYYLFISQIIAFDELKTDYKNPIDQCNSLNPVISLQHFCTFYEVGKINHFSLFQLVIPEYAVHIFFNILFLFSGEWWAFAFNLPLIAYHIHRYMNRPIMSSFGLYDPTNIMNADVLSKCQREGWIKLAFYLLSFFFYLYGYLYLI